MNTKEVFNTHLAGCNCWSICVHLIFQISLVESFLLYSNQELELPSSAPKYNSFPQLSSLAGCNRTEFWTEQIAQSRVPIFSMCHGNFAWLVTTISFLEKRSPISSTSCHSSVWTTAFSLKLAEIQGKEDSSTAGSIKLCTRIWLFKPWFYVSSWTVFFMLIHCCLTSSWEYKGTLTIARFYELFLKSWTKFALTQPVKGCLLNFCKVPASWSSEASVSDPLYQGSLMCWIIV